MDVPVCRECKTTKLTNDDNIQICVSIIFGTKYNSLMRNKLRSPPKKNNLKPHNTTSQKS